MSMRLYVDVSPIAFGSNVGALIIRIGFWDPLYYIHYNEEPPKIELAINCPYSTRLVGWS